MSYIRCLSNPEGLYAYGDSTGRVCIHIDEAYSSKGHQGSFHIPSDKLTAAIRAFDKDYDQPVEVEGVKIAEVHVFEDTLECVSDEWETAEQRKQRLLDRLSGRDNRKTRYGIRIEFEERWMILWRVTFEYFSRGFLRD